MGNDRASLEATALRFACVEKDRLAVMHTRGIDGGIRLHDTLAGAEAACAEDEHVLVVEGDGTVPNLDPYRRPEPVTAAGGLIVRDAAEEAELLLIFRRGAWDLPKGKLDPGESVEECAVREVREEVGIENLTVLGPAGTTLHGYPERKRYLVKTTHWYFMQTPERTFTPEEREGIEAVRWVPWREAQEMLGYESLRRHLARLTPPSSASAR